MQLELAATACFSAMVYLDQKGSQEWMIVFQIVGSIYAILMMYKEKLLMDANPESFTAKINSMIGIFGYIIFFLTASLSFSGHFIEGKAFIGAAFFITLSIMLKLLNYLTSKDRYGKKRNIIKNPNKCFILGCICAVDYCLFVISACESLTIEDHYAELSGVANVCSWVGVLAHSGWLYFCSLEKDKGGSSSKSQYSVAPVREDDDTMMMAEND